MKYEKPEISFIELDLETDVMRPSSPPPEPGDTSIF